MRISGGTLRGMKLVSPPGDRIRPTSEKVRQALFDILGSRIRGLAMLDLCCGTGIMGLEALSRGVSNCLFVDSSGEACRTVERNLEKTKLNEQSRVMKTDVLRFLKQWHSGDQAWFVYVDPPYRKERLYRSILTTLAEKGRNGSLIVVMEHPLTLDVQPPEGLILRDERRYGSTRISIFTTEAAVW